MTLDLAREILGEDAPKDDGHLERMVEGADRLARLVVELYRETRNREAQVNEAK